MTSRTDFIARTAAGVAIETFESRELALAWADERGDLFPGWSVVAVHQRVITRETVLRQDPTARSAAA